MLCRRAVLGAVALATLLGPLAFLPSQAADACRGVRARPDGWTQINRPAFDDYTGLEDVVHGEPLPGQPDVLLLSNGTTVVRSADGGCTWASVFLAESTSFVSPGPGSIVDIETAPLRGGSRRVWMLANENGAVDVGLEINGTGVRPGSRPRVYRSDDGGRTWRDMSAGLAIQGQVAEGIATRLRAHPFFPDVAYVTSSPTAKLGSEEVYVTTDAGVTWSRQTALLDQTTSLQDMALDPYDGRRVYAWDARFTYRSDNSGQTFSALPVPVPVSAVDTGPWGAAGRFTTFFSAAPPVALASPDGGRTLFPLSPPGGITSVARFGSDGLALSLTAYSGGRRVWVGPAGVAAPRDISPDNTTVLDVDAVAGTFLNYGKGNSDYKVVAVTPNGMLKRDPLAPVPKRKLPPIGKLDDCQPDRTAGVSFRASTPELVLKPGETRRVDYAADVPPVPTDLDVHFISDTTGSMQGLIAGLRSDIREIVDDLCTARVPVWFGVGDFREYPGAPYGGSACLGNCPPDPEQYPYRRIRAVGPPNAELRAAINQLDTGGGATDGGDAGLEALFQSATGAGRTYLGTRVLNPGQGAEFRDGALKVIVMATDTSWHEATPGYPGPSSADTFNVLRQRGIKVVGLAVGQGGSTGALPGQNNVGQLRTVAAATGTLAPEGGTDCDGDGTVDLPEGDPLVCILDNGFSGNVGVGPAMVGLLDAIEDRAAIGVEVEVPPAFLAPGAKLIANDLDVKERNRLGFSSQFRCTQASFGQRVTAIARLVSRGFVLGQTTISIRCGTPPPPASEPRLPPIKPAIAAALAPAAPPPAPVPAQQPQAQPNSNPNPQVNPNIQAGGAYEEQETAQLAYAVTELEEQQRAEGGELAMVAHDRAPSPALPYAAAAIMASAAGWAMSRRSSRAEARIPR